MSASHIELRGVEVHNLKQVDLDIPHHELVVLCGVSGSGKTSLALDTLYAEGQRRYIESFSAYTRQFLERLEKPAAERIDGIPPSIAVMQQSPSRSTRANVGTATEILDYLRLLIAKIGKTNCYGCNRLVRRDNPDSVVELLTTLQDSTRYMVTFPLRFDPETETRASLQELLEDGFIRIVLDDCVLRLEDVLDRPGLRDAKVNVVVDRLTGSTDLARVRDSLETAFSQGAGRATVFVDKLADSEHPLQERASTRLIDGKEWLQANFNKRIVCDECDIVYPTPTPKLFSFNSPLGACPACEGFGNLVRIDMGLVVPDPSKSLKEGAIAPWSTPAYEHELRELLDLADDYQLRVDVPFRELSEDELSLIRSGVPERGIRGPKWLLRMARETKIQDAPTRLSKSLEKLYPLRRVLWWPFAQREFGNADRRAQHR